MGLMRLFLAAMLVAAATFFGVVIAGLLTGALLLKSIGRRWQAGRSDRSDGHRPLREMRRVEPIAPGQDPADAAVPVLVLPDIERPNR